jgi:threonine dehydrogenase-like Zn-dependent dehydrogenase
VRAFVVTAPGQAEVTETGPPVPAPGEAVITVERAGVCGTDAEFFSGEMAYLHEGHAWFPMRLGHEWMGTVTGAGPGVDPAWLGRRVTGDTMLGCGRCRRCQRGHQHVCADREEVGVRGGALAEPGGNALRAAQAARLRPGDRLLILGPGTIGLLAALFARADGADVHLLGVTPESLRFARTLGFGSVWTAATLPDLPFDAVIDASNDAALPARAVDLVEPGGTVVGIGLAGRPSLVDTRRLVLKDVTMTGVLSGSPGLAGAISRYAAGQVDPAPLVAATVGLADLAGVLAGRRPPGAGDGPKIQVDPRPGGAGPAAG